MAHATETNARDWLRAHEYGDIAEEIDAVTAGWRAAGKSTRRNWWDVLAGKRNGSPRVAGGREWPVLAVARRRQGLPPAKIALRRRRREVPPIVRTTGRWAAPENAGPHKGLGSS